MSITKDPDPTDTILPLDRTPASDQVLPSTGLRLTPDLLELIRIRVKWIALLMVGLNVFGVVMAVVMLLRGADVVGASFNIVTQSICLAFALLVWLVARGYRLSDTTVLYLGLTLEVLLCFVGASAAQLWFFRETGVMLFMSWVAPTVILFPVLIPGPPRIMLVAAIAAASMEPIVALSFWALEIYPLEDFARGLPGTLINPTLAVLIAYVASRIIYGLNVDVAKAKQMGSYHLESLLGRGGMGEVWRAKHRMLARPAAIKLIRPDAVGTDEASGHTLLQRFEREAQATASLRSPHTVEIYDFGLSKDGAFFYVMELLDGINLDTLVKEHGPLPAERVVHLLKQVCHSLEEAHEAGLTHRDIKPANLFICRYGRDNDFVKLLDFGLVKKQQAAAEGDQGDLTQHGTAVGTPSFMAPEMLWDGGPIDGRADVYAVGCVAYWLLTGMLVFEGPSAMAVIVKHARDVPEPPSTRSEMDIPHDLERIVMACLEKEPEKRPQSAVDLARRLDEVDLDQPWTDQRAVAWWDQHLPARIGA